MSQSLKIKNNIFTCALWTKILFSVKVNALRRHTQAVRERSAKPLCNSSILFGAFFGGVAHLARALAWHARGKGFKSPHLHKDWKVFLPVFFLS